MLEIDGVEIKQGLCFKHRRRGAYDIEHFVIDVDDDKVVFSRGHRQPETLSIEKFKKVFEKQVVPEYMLNAAYLQHHYFVLQAALGGAVDLRALWEDLKDQYEDPYDYYCNCNED